MMDKLNVNRLVNRASFLHERLTLGWIPDFSERNEEKATARLNRWCQLVARGNWADFERRLAWDGLDRQSALQLLCDGSFAADVAVPAWFTFLEDVLKQANVSGIAIPETQESGESIAYPAIICPFLTVAEVRLLQVVEEQFDVFSPTAQQALQNYLIEQLIALAKPTLEQMGLLAHMERRGLEGLCDGYPMLVRQLAVRCLQWVREIVLFLERFSADSQRYSIFSKNGISGLALGLSDPHNGGCTVWRVTLENGTVMAYKPKSLAQDKAWNDLIVWCNQQGLSPQLGHLWTLPHDDYGWMEWVETEPVPAEPQLYYQQIGMMLGLLQMLNASDVHHENLLCHAGQPLLIDAEMLPYPQIVGEADRLDVMRTGLLPRWANRIEIGGISATLHWPEICTGYETIMHFLADKWDAITPMLAAFQRGYVRVAPRPTNAYLRLRDHLRHPAFLQNGIDFSIETDRLATTYLLTHSQFAPLISAEHHALAQGDIPIFHAEIGQPNLKFDGGEIENCLVWSEIKLPNVIEQQQSLGLIRASTDDIPYYKQSLSPFPEPVEGRRESISDTPFLDHAIAIGHILTERTTSFSDRSLSWIANQYNPRSQLDQHQLIGEDFYAGRSGIAFFLVALAGDSPQRTRRSQRKEERDYGVVDGLAGRVLELLSADLPQAITIGDQLLAYESIWQNQDRALGGFSHGAAGIAYALTQLYEACGERRFLESVERAWTFQRTLYNKEVGNWQDRRGKEPVYLSNWCHGAAGIGLAAAGCLGSLPELEDVVERAVKVILEDDDEGGLDTLCCGEFGRIDSLLEMGLLLNRPVWVNHASRLAQAALSRATTQQYFSLYDQIPPHIFNPTFFRGVAGIGYTLLRLAAVTGEIERDLPCALRWDIK